MDTMPKLADIDMSALDVQPTRKPVKTKPPKREYPQYHGATMGDIIGVREAMTLAMEAKRLVRAVDAVLSRQGEYRDRAVEVMRVTLTDECPHLLDVVRGKGK